MKIIQWLKGLFVRQEVVYAPKVTATIWTENNAQALKDFLGSPTGSNFMEHLEGSEAATNSWAVGMGAESREWKAGVAYGRPLVRGQILAMARTKEDVGREKDAEDQKNFEALQKMLNDRARGVSHRFNDVDINDDLKY